MSAVKTQIRPGLIARAILALAVLALTTFRAEAFFFGFGAVKTVWTIESEAPLFDPSKGVKLMPGSEDIALIERRRDRVVMSSLQPPLLREEDSFPNLRAYALPYKDGEYDVDRLFSGRAIEVYGSIFESWVQSPFGGDAVSFHPSGYDGVFIAQMRRTVSDRIKIRYAYVRIINGRLVTQLQTLKFDPTSLPETAQIGVINEVSKMVTVRDRATLRRALDTQDAAQTHSLLDPQPSLRDLNARFSLSGDVIATRAEVASELCLYFAQSPFAMGRELPPHFAGVPFQNIQSDRAIPFCEFAIASGVKEPPVRYAASRALTKLAWEQQDTGILARAEAIMDSLAADGLKVAQTSVAQRYMGDFTRERDTAAARSALEALAEEDNEVAAYTLGLFLKEGYLPSSDDTAAELYLRRALRGGVEQAYGELGALLLALGSAESHKRAIRVLENGAFKRDTQSERLLARQLFDQGFNRLAYLYFDRAAAKGDAEALHLRGFLQMTGRGTPLSTRKAEEDLRLAVRLGRQDAEIELGGLMCRDRIANPSAEARAEGRAMLNAAQERGAGNAAFYLERCLE